MKLKNVLGLSLALLALVVFPASAGTQDETAHQQALSQMLGAAQVADEALLELDMAASKPGANRELLQHIRSHVTRDDMLKLFVPAYAPLVPAETARLIATGFATPDGKKTAAAMIASIRQAGKPAARKAPTADLKAMQRFTRTPAWRQFVDARERARPESTKALKAWFGSYQPELMQKGYEAMDSYYDAVQPEGTESLPRFSPAPVGISYIDAGMEHHSQIQWRRVNAELRFDKDMRDVGVANFLIPASLSSPQVVAASLAKMDRLDSHHEAYLLERELALKEFADGMSAINFPEGKNPASIQQGFEEQQKYQERIAKNGRSMLNTMRNLLVFANDRKGRIQVEGANLLFHSNDDVAMYQAYVSQLDRDRHERETLVANASRRSVNLF